MKDTKMKKGVRSLNRGTSYFFFFFFFLFLRTKKNPRNRRRILNFLIFISQVNRDPCTMFIHEIDDLLVALAEHKFPLIEGGKNSSLMFILSWLISRTLPFAAQILLVFPLAYSSCAENLKKSKGKIE